MVVATRRGTIGPAVATTFRTTRIYILGFEQWGHPFLPIYFSVRKVIRGHLSFWNERSHGFESN